MFVQKLLGFTGIYFGLLTWFADQGPNSRTKGLRLRSPFFELQEKSFSLELANVILSQETKTLSSGKISVRGVLIHVKSFFLADHGDHHWTDAWKTDINLLNTTPWGPAIQLNKSKKSPNTFSEMLLAFLNPKHGNILTIYDDLQQIFAFCATLPARKGLALPNSQSPRAFWSSADICPSYVCAREHFYFTCIRSVKTVRLSHQP